MTVFKLCLKITKSKLLMIIIYFLVFNAIAMSLSFSIKDKPQVGFNAEKPKFTIINRDVESPLIEGMTQFISTKGTKVEIADQPEKLQDAAFYNATDYIIIIPEGFTKDFEQGRAQLETVKFPGSPSGYNMELLVNRYLKAVKMYKDSNLGLSHEEIASLVEKDISTPVETKMLNFDKNDNSSKRFMLYNIYVPYILTLVIVLCVTSIMISMEKPDIRMRNLSGPKSNLNISMSMLSFTFVFGVVIWLATNIGAILINVKYISGANIKTIGLVLANSFTYMLFCVAVSLLIGIFVKSSNGQNAAANILGLALSFLGGIFVPLDFLSQSVIKFSKFTPTYWHTSNLKLIDTLPSWNLENLEPIFVGMAVQIGFAAMVFSIFLAVRRHKYSQDTI